MMNLDESQRKAVALWLADGLKLSEIQSRLASQFGLRLTYMDVRLLVDDLKLMPKDIEAPPPPAPVDSLLAGAPAAKPGAIPASSPPAAAEPPRAPGGVSVAVDQLARPGAVVSGKVTFSDGQSAEWYLDELNRLGIVPKQQRYKPAAADLQQFQMALGEELSKY